MFCYGNVLADRFVMKTILYWVLYGKNIAMVNDLGESFAVGLSKINITMEMAQFTVLLWRWPGLQYCYRDAFGDMFATDTCKYDSLKTTWGEVWHFTLKEECLFLTLSRNDRLLGLH